MTPENQFIEYGRPVEIHCVLDKDFVEKNGQSASSRLTFLEASRGTVNPPTKIVCLLFSYFF